jgi:hypothetical protein
VRRFARISAYTCCACARVTPIAAANPAAPTPWFKAQSARSIFRYGKPNRTPPSSAACCRCPWSAARCTPLRAAQDAARARDLGSHVARLRGGGAKVDVELASLEGPLKLFGGGSWTRSAGLVVSGSAEARAASVAPFLRNGARSTATCAATSATRAPGAAAAPPSAPRANRAPADGRRAGPKRTRSLVEHLARPFRAAPPAFIRVFVSGGDRADLDLRPERLPEEEPRAARMRPQREHVERLHLDSRSLRPLAHHDRAQERPVLRRRRARCRGDRRGRQAARLEVFRGTLGSRSIDVPCGHSATGAPVATASW